MIYSFFNQLKFIIVCLHPFIELLMSACVSAGKKKDIYMKLLDRSLTLKQVIVIFLNYHGRLKFYGSRLLQIKVEYALPVVWFVS